MKRLTGILIGLLLTGSVLTPAITTALETNLIANPSVEEAASAGTPSNWTSNTWGTNTANFAHLNEGHSGSKSVKTEITAYTDGDAKWYFDPVTILPSSSYTFTDYYKSSVSTEAVVQFTHADNSKSYQLLGTVTPSSEWVQASFTFTTPASGAKVSVFHIVAGVGWLIVDDASLTSTTTPPPPPPSTNLVANPSLEQATTTTPKKPVAWASNKWGTNTANFTYPTNGHTGSRSVKTNVTAYTDGDAKWYFQPVSVSPGAAYSYGTWYKANVATNVFAWFTHNDGSNTYEWLGSVPASHTVWQQASLNVVAPATATKVSIFHVVSSVGWLQIDDVSLSESSPPPPPSQGVPNPSVEEVSAQDPNLPDKWFTNSWGSNTPTFEYLNEGYNSDRSVKVTLSNYTDGDAKWHFQPITNFEEGETYSFSARYKTNTLPHIAIAYVKDDGTNFFQGVRDPFPSDNQNEWQLFNTSFTVPSDVQSMTVYFFIKSNGWLQVDDYNIEPYEPVGFNRPLVSLTFDDSFVDNIDTALPVMESYGFKSTQCYGSAFVEAVEEGEEAVQTFYDAGHEICSHTVTHPFLTQLTSSEVDYELAHSQQVLQNIIGVPVVNFASPYGDYNFEVVQAIKNYYRSHRTVDEGYNSKDNFDIDRILVKNMLVGTTLEEYQSWLDYAKATDTWLVLVYHRVTSAPDIEPFDTPEDQFQAQMAALDASGLTVKTYNAALDELVPQL